MFGHHFNIHYVGAKLMKYKCVIFDCDGVLVDSESIGARVWVEMAKKLGLSISFKKAFDEFTGKSFNSVVESLSEKAKTEIPDDFEKEFRAKTYSAFQADLQPINGIHDVLKKITVPFCVASSGPREKIDLNLAKVDLISFFPSDRIFSCYDIRKWKPDPAIYLYAAKQMGFRPEDCVVIEDSPFGVQAAIAGGFDVLIYADKDKEKKFNVKDQIFFDKMEMLNKILTH
jgi:HAD superfamily hydrolase (TIGR01509 family)